jgi:gamma-glutamylputrescine oxidase
MSISKWLDQTQKSISQHYDVVIIGGGIAGLSTAYWLQKQDSKLRMALIEKNRIGFGASGRNAGFVTCGSTEHFLKLEKDFGLEKATEIWKFSEENHRLLREEIIQDQANKVDYRQTGSCTVAPNEPQWEKYQAIAATMKKSGIDVRQVTTREMENDYGVTGFVGGIDYAGDGYIDPIKLLNLLRSKVKLDIFESTEVFALNQQADHELVQTDQGLFRADKVILTLNAYLPLLMKDFAKLITPGRGQILMTEPLPAFVRGPCYLTKHLCYFRQLPTGHLLVGGFRNLDRETENTYADQTTELIQSALLNFIRDHFKYGPQAKIAYQWSGIMGFSPDGQMLLGPVPDRDSLQVMAGCSGHGMGLSFHAAKTLVDSFYGKAVPSHLRLQRFNSEI